MGPWRRRSLCHVVLGRDPVNGYVSQPMCELSARSRNELEVVGDAWILDEIGRWIDEFDERQGDLDRCQARLLGGTEQSELLSVLTLVVWCHVFEQAVEYDRELPGYVSERGSRSHASSGEAVVHIAKRRAGHGVKYDPANL